MRIRYVALTAVATVGLLLFGSTPAHADPSLDEVKEQVQKKGDELEAIIEDYNAAKEDLDKSEKRRRAIEKNLGPMRDEVELAQEAVDDIASATYSGGNLSEVSIMFAGSPDQTLERLSLLSQLGQTQIADIREFNEASQALLDEEAELDDLIKEQKEIKSDLKKKKNKIEGDLADLKELQDQLEPPPPPPNVPPPPSGDAGVAVQFAYDQLGEDYVYGAGGPDTWDCSGLTQGAWGAAGYSLPHNAAMQYNQLPHVSRSQLAAGDLVFYNDLNHVGIFVGDGTIVHAPTSGQTVSTAPIDSMPIVGYGRPG